ncbi:type IV pilus biogenesis protein PilP, partial [Oceanicella sp. SM1341]|uniref:type IV pilus biogenesis protein PilP n=1 Tax=Oceanicella sp. SM1341 TaxID=1548889 RepID=UPI00130066F5
TGLRREANVRQSAQPQARPGSSAPAPRAAATTQPASALSPKEADEPKPRPGSVRAQAPAPEISSASRYAVGRTPQPPERPARIAAKAVRQPAGAVPTTAVAVVKTPVNISTSAAATDSGLFDRDALNLIGIYGTEHSRRALLRLPTGKYVRVTRGDSFEGWKVAAISEDAVHLLRSGETQVLKIPHK